MSSQRTPSEAVTGGLMISASKPSCFSHRRFVVLSLTLACAALMGLIAVYSYKPDDPVPDEILLDYKLVPQGLCPSAYAVSPNAITYYALEYWETYLRTYWDCFNDMSTCPSADTLTSLPPSFLQLAICNMCLEHRCGSSKHVCAASGGYTYPGTYDSKRCMCGCCRQQCFAPPQCNAAPFTEAEINATFTEDFCQAQNLQVKNWTESVPSEQVARLMGLK
mmetsp:Transcript_7246/g.19737  ORF Transcript_7246/g.19737 Transcript_7246/m.19737 type:complete len:221 (+) Transcript_7246:134-796(+)